MGGIAWFGRHDGYDAQKSACASCELHDIRDARFSRALASKQSTLARSVELTSLTMEQQTLEEALRRVAEAVRAACLRAALDGYERAGLGGLCEAGRWEMAMDSIQSLDVKAVVRDIPRGSSGIAQPDEVHRI